MSLESLLPELRRDGWCHVVVVPDLQAVRTPEDRKVSSWSDLAYPTRCHPRPGAARIDEYLDICHREKDTYG